MYFQNYRNYQHGQPSKIGVLITNLGTPDAPTREALKIYLKQFLSDPRVVEPPPSRFIWRLILNGIILNTRPQKSAEAYQTVWNQEGPGSPLLNISKRQLQGIQERVQHSFAGDVVFELGMRYGNPSIPSALESLQKQGCDQILVLPLYPQYAAATTASTFDEVFDTLKTWRWVPEIRTINHYHRHPGYIKALAQSIRDYQAEHGKPDLLVFSYHGIPKRYWDNGDPYPCHCFVTTRLVREELGLSEDQVTTTFQSRFGKEPWVQPYTDETMKTLPKEGVKNVQVICPGFSADCLETIEEIGEENRDYFLEAGGEKFGYIPCLNDRPDHLSALSELIIKNISGWSEPLDENELEKVKKNYTLRLKNSNHQT
ncbi:ferrochelatase [Galenea microaerophila]